MYFGARICIPVLRVGTKPKPKARRPRYRLGTFIDVCGFLEMAPSGQRRARDWGSGLWGRLEGQGTYYVVIFSVIITMTITPMRIPFRALINHL